MFPKTAISVLATAIVVTLGSFSALAQSAAKPTFQIAPTRLRVSTGDVHKPAGVAINNRGKVGIHIERFKLPAVLSFRITAFRESGSGRMELRNAANSSRFERLQRAGFVLYPGGMILGEFVSKSGARPGNYVASIAYRDPRGRSRSQAISVFAYEKLNPAQCRSNRDVCFMAFGDQGTADANQRRVGKAMKRFYDDPKFRTDFVIGLGDNFYGTGLTLFNRKKRFKEFEDIYSGIDTKFYMSLGNHDHLGDWRNQMKYQRCSKRWCSESWNTKRWVMPSNYYTFRKGDVEFFVIDSPRIDSRIGTRAFALTGMNTMLRWLETKLRASNAKWKVVYGHHPVFNYSESHGDELGSIVKRLLPILVKYKVDVHLGGHEHDQQHIRLPSYDRFSELENIDFVVTGSAGKSNGHPGRGPHTKFSDASLGFTYLQISGDRLSISFVKAEANGTPKVIYEMTRKKDLNWRYRRRLDTSVIRARPGRRPKRR